MIKKPTIMRKPEILAYAPNGAFDIPTYIVSVAIEYFSGEISFVEAKGQLYDGGHIHGIESDAEILSKLDRSLKGNEKYFDYAD